MKSTFGSKRKARKIQVDEDEEGDGAQDAPTETLNTCKFPNPIPATPADYLNPADVF